ncbi:hypothetical protein IHN63_04360 [Deinococcus sp. 6YEL10]|uniref:hypothetical protein n=1 Tax=Deinococcus sp. 6YEL10 TaxID=2745870 RepID=UPI001E2A2FD0|nr:hypothetical protein [Deinococcus sp. 6YEL10]MCD0160535.1 hypothetical protein [Deinococcus sp. 6YEL10]
MQALFGSFSAQFGKQLILGTLLPVSVFLALWIVIMEPMVPERFSLLRHLTFPSDTWQVGAFAFLSVVIASVLYNVNYTLVRFMEGYPWRGSLYGHWRQRIYIARHARLTAQIQALVALLSAEIPVLRDPQQIALLERQLGTFRIQLGSTYPPAPQHVLPTRLGNIIRAFETYPRTTYGLDGIIIWPALVAIMDKDELEIVNESRTSFDFAVQLTVLAAAFGAFSSGYGLVIGLTSNPRASLPFLLATGLAGALALIAYQMACVAAMNWGVDVRRAVDLNRQALWTRFGVKDSFGDIQDERVLGRQLSQQLIYGDQLYYEAATDQQMSEQPYFKAPAVRSAPAAVTALGNVLPITRSVRVLFQDNIRIQVRVEGFQDAVATDVALTDALPAGYAFKTGTAKLDGVATEPHGSQNLTFILGDMAIGTVRIVEYDAIYLKP